MGCAFAQVFAAVDGEAPVAGDLVGDLNLPAVHGERGELLRVDLGIAGTLLEGIPGRREPLPSFWRTVTNPRTLRQNTHLGALNGARVVVRVDATE